MGWTLDKIKAKVRKITGRPTIGQLSEADLLDVINDFYQNRLPSRVDLSKLRGWWTFNTTTGVDFQAVPSTVRAIIPPITLGGYDVDFYTSPGLFYGQFPRPGEPYTAGQPTAVLLDLAGAAGARQIIMRPPPDDIYEFRVAAFLTLAALSGESPPLEDQWGLLICHGAAIDIFMTHGQGEEAGSSAGVVQNLLGEVACANVLQRSSDRAAPRW